MKKIINILEIFCGTKSISKAFKTIEKDNDNYEFNIISLDIDKRFKPTHLCNILDFNYKQYPKDYFTFIHSSPPCNTFSHMRHTNLGKKIKNGNGKIYTKESLEEDIINFGLPPLYKTQEIINYFKPKYYFIENPSTSKMKNYIDNKDFLYDINKYIVSYCKYGFDYRKNTSFWTNLKGFNPKICNKNNPCNHIINNKHINKIENLGGQECFKNKCIKYRIPQELLIELFSLAIDNLNYIIKDNNKVDEIRPVEYTNDHIENKYNI